jgi:hypothetical protein
MKTVSAIIKEFPKATGRHIKRGKKVTGDDNFLQILLLRFQIPTSDSALTRSHGYTCP